MSRSCPRCEHGPPLGPVETGGVAVDFCAACNGAWVGGDDWGPLFGRPVAATGAGEPSQLDCPECTEDDPSRVVRLERRHAGEGGRVEIDACPDCGGAWLDRGEMAALRKAPRPAHDEPDAASRTDASPTPSAAAARAASDVSGPDPKAWTLTLVQMGAAVLFTFGLALPFVLIGLLPAWFRYKTMKYEIDEKGVGVSWGLLFHQSTYLTYDKIQDIHLSRGLLERWMGLGTVEVQTASGSAAAEVSLFGLGDHELVRDFLYARMRGTRDEPTAGEDEGAGAAAAGGDDVVSLLREVGAEVRALREAIERRDRGQGGAP